MSRPSRNNSLHGTQSQDIIMGPPPLPAQVALSTSLSSTHKSKDSADVTEKYKKLKRKYFELEQKLKEANEELRGSGERNVKWRSERSALLERIQELETNHVANPNAIIPSPPFSAYPRYLLSARNQRQFTANLDRGMIEAEQEGDVDPLLLSRHVGPQARRRQEAEIKEKQEEEAREARRVSRRPRAGQKSKEPHSNPPLTYAPPHPHPSSNLPSPSPIRSPNHERSVPSPVLVSSTGTRLRLKPPAPPSAPRESSPGPNLGAGSPSLQHQQQQHGGGGPPPQSLPQLQPLQPPQQHSPRQQAQSSHAPSQQSHHPSPPLHQQPPRQTLVDPQPPLETQQQPLPPPHRDSPQDSPQLLPLSSPPEPRERSESLSPAISQLAISPRDELPPAPSSQSSMQGLMTLSPTSQYRQTPLDPMKAAQSQMQMTLRPQIAVGAVRPSEVQRHAKPKRLKAHTVTTKSFSIPMVPRDKQGRPSLPLNVGIMTVINLGEVCMREHFHTERYIFPVGYDVTRRYLSTTDPNSEVVYHCRILDGGDGPKFQIVAADALDKPVVAGTATGAWSVIVRAANIIRNRQHSNSVSGPDFFGLGQNTIKHLIQELPGADRLKDYVWQNFVEGGPLGGRHAAVIPALPEELDANGYPLNAAATYYYDRGELLELDKPGELRIIQVDSEEIQQAAQAKAARAGGNGATASGSGSASTSNGSTPGANPGSTPMTTTIKPITFHQEYTMLPPGREERGNGESKRGRERKNSKASNASSYDEYNGNGNVEVHHHHPNTRASARSHSRSQSHSHSQSPAIPHRNTSHSPLLHRSERNSQPPIPGVLPSPTQPTFTTSHQIAGPTTTRPTMTIIHTGIPYVPPPPTKINGTIRPGPNVQQPIQVMPQSPPPVPATFASIMNAYPSSPMGDGRGMQISETPVEYVYPSGR